MKHLTLKIVLIFTIVLGSGCSYKTPVNTVQSVNVYSSYDEKVPGQFALVVNVDRSLLDKTISASSYACSAHKYPIALSDSFISSLKEANASIFEAIVTRTTMPSSEEMNRDQLAGYIFITAKLFEPRIQFQSGFWTVSAVATTDIGFDYTIRDKNNTLILSGTVSGNRTADGDAGGACGGGSNVLAESVTKSMRDALERYGERVSNSPKLREIFK